MDCPSLALPLMMIVCACISESSSFLHRLFSNMRWPTSSLVFVPPDIVFPLICTTFCSPDGSAEPVNTVPTDTFSIIISRTGVEPRSIRNVLLPSTYSVGTSSGRSAPRTLAAYTPLSPRANDLSESMVSLAITPPPTADPANRNVAAICGLRPMLRSKL